MPSLTLRQLEYLRAVAREGSVTAAARALGVSQPAVTAQIRQLEEVLGHELFDRSGRSLELNADGQTALDYAEEIHRLSRELEETVRGQAGDRPLRVAVGLAGTIPNLVAIQLLDAAFGSEEPVRVVVREKRTDRLLADLATHEVDLVLADMPVPPNVSVRAFNHPLGSSPIDILGPPLIAHRVRAGFPGSLDGAPFLVPADGYALRRSLEDWFAANGIQPHIVAEIEDTDLINVLAEGGAGLFAAPSLIADDLRVRYAVEVVGRAEGIVERFYAITADRRIRHPLVAAIAEAARRELHRAGELETGEV